MNRTCVLEGDGFRISFEMEALKTEKDDLTAKKYVDLVVEIKLDSTLKGLTMESVPTITAIKDLHNLTQYLEQHLAKLAETPNKESWTFVAGDGFQLQAFEGSLFLEPASEFTLRCMVNVGTSSEDGTSVYAGAEGVVTIKDTIAFVASMRAALAELAS
ncbi:MAG TPA: hypothetical protein VM911_05285 [Pyrinomonadaceae bacterium]|nr:hypothetical protein [Pyrinomonadaceae bacterium]